MEKYILAKYELVVGLEVHAQLSSQSKIFSGDANKFGSEPNTLISIVTLACPGTLPKLNAEVVRFAIKMGLACGCEISRYNTFDRKNYFYPDLPKGFQTTQDKNPVCKGGGLHLRLADGGDPYIRLNRIHLEEDAGKSLHQQGSRETLVDLNRAGVPLIEIVTEPDIRQPAEAFQMLTQIRQLVRYLGICDGNMEQGSLRCDANISVRKKGEPRLGTKVEVKNMNSMRNVQAAIAHEFERQVAMAEAGETIVSETRLFDVDKGKTFAMRTKEELNDYRYFPEPDLPPFVVTDEMLAEIEAEMPELPHELFEKFTATYGLPAYDAGVLTENRGTAMFFEALCQYTRNYKAASNWVMTQVKSWLNQQQTAMEDFPLQPAQIAELIALVDNQQVSHSAASGPLFRAFALNPDTSAEKLAGQLNLLQVSSEEQIVPVIKQVLGQHPDKVKAYKKGKKNLIGMFMGEVMKAGKGKIDPGKANLLIREVLEGM